MAGGNPNETIRLTADFDDVTRSLKEMNSIVRSSKAEFDSATAGVTKWQNTTAGLEAKQKQLNNTLNVRAQMMERYQAALQREIAEYGKESVEVRNRQAQIDRLQATMDREQKQLDKTTSSLEKLTRGFKEAGVDAKKYDNNLEKLNQNIKEQESTVRRLSLAYQQSLKANGKNAEETKALGRALQKEKQTLSELHGQMNKAEADAKGMSNANKNMGDSAQKAKEGFTVLKGVLSNLISQGIRKAVQEAKELAKEVLDVGMSFESQMSQVKAISGATGKDFDALKEKAKEMGASTKYTATESGEALKYMAQAGWKTEDMLEGLEGVMNLAAASGEDLGNTSDIVTDQLTAFGMKASETGRFVDVLAATASNSNTDVAMMGETFKQVAPLAGALGYDVEDMAIAIGTLANSGTKASKAGTDLRNILTRIKTNAGATKTSIGAMEVVTQKLGVSLQDSHGKTKSFNKVLAECKKAWKGLSDEEKTAYAKLIGGQRGLSSWLTLMGASKKEVDKLSTSIKNSGGAAKEMAETMQDNVEGGLTKLKSKIEGKLLEIYEAMKPALERGIEMISQFIDTIDFKKVGEGLANFASGFLNFIKTIIQNLPTIIGYIKNFGIALGVAFVVTKVASFVQAIIGMVQAVGAATTAMGAMSVVMSAMPIVAIAGAIAGIVGAIGMFASESDEASRHVSNLTSEQKELCDALKETAKASDEAKSARADATAGIEGEMSYVEELKDEYNSLINKNGKVKKGYEDRAEAILNTMAKAMGVERSEIDKNIEANGRLEASFDSLMVKRKMNALSEAYADDYQNAIKNQKEQRENLAKINEQYLEMQKVHQHLVDLHEKYNKARESGDQEQIDAITKECEAYVAEHGSLEEVTGAFSDLINARNDAMTAYNNSMDVIQKQEAINEAIASGSTAKMQAVFDSVTTGIKTAGSATKEELEQQAEAVQTTAEQMMNAAGEWQSGITVQALQEQKNVLKKAKEQLGEELTDDDVRKFAIAKAKALGESIPKSVVDGLNSAKTGKDAEKIVGKYVKFDNLVKQAGQYGIAIPKSLAEGISSESTDVGAAIKTVKSYIKLGDAVNKLKDQGVTIPKKLAEGIRDGNVDVEDAVKKLNKKIKLDKNLSADAKKEAMKALEGIAYEFGKANKVEKNAKDTSKKATKALDGKSEAKKAGSGTIEHYNQGIASGQGKAKTTAKGVADNAKSGLSVDTYGSGNNFTQGFINGINAKKQEAYNAGYSVGQASHQGLKKGQQEGSPSKLTRKSGRYFVEGFTLGIKDRFKDSVKAAVNLVQASMNAVDKTADMHSPSKKMFTKGVNLVAGLVNGIISSTGSVKSATSNVTKSILSGIPEKYDNVKKAQKALAKLQGTKVTKSIKGMSLAKVNKEIDKATEKIKTYRKQLANLYGTGVTDDIKGLNQKQLQKAIKKAKKDLPKLKQQLAKEYGIEVDARINKMGVKQIQKEIKKLKAARDELNSLGIELTPELKALSASKLQAWIKSWKDPLNVMAREVADLSGKMIKDKFQDIISETGKQTTALVDVAKSGVASVVAELSKLNNFNFSEVGTNASNVFSKAISKKVDYTTKKLEYLISERENEYEGVIDAYENARDARKDEIDALKDATLDKISSNQEKELKQLEKAYNDEVKSIEKARDSRVKALENQRDKEVKALEKKISKTSDKNKKKRLQAQLKDLKSAYSEQIKVVKANAKDELSYLKTKNKNQQKEIKDYNSHITEQEKDRFQSMQDQADESYGALIDNQKEYLETFKTGSGEFMAGFEDALKEYESAATELINSTINGVNDKYQKMYDNLLSKQNTLTTKLRDMNQLFSVSGANVLKVEDIEESTRKMENYYNKVANLRGKVSEEVIDKIIASGVDEGSAYADYLLALPADKLQEYSRQVENYYKKADELGAKLYKDDMDKLAYDYQQAIKDAFAGIEGELKTLGQQIFQGFTEGMVDNIDYMSQPVKDIVSAMITQFKSELDIHSPSRVMRELGEYTGKGFAEGLSESMSEANSEARENVAELIRTMSGVNAEIDKINMSGVVSKARGAMQKAAGAVMANNRTVNTEQTINNNYNLVQNNTSPKSLSALETYQARRAQIAQLKLLGV